MERNTLPWSSLQHQFHALWTAQDTILGELQAVYEKIIQALMQAIAVDPRSLQSDVNRVWESLAQLAAFIEGVDGRFDRFHVRLETFEQIFLTDNPSSITRVPPFQTARSHLGGTNTIQSGISSASTLIPTQ